MDLAHEGLSRALTELDRSTNRLAFALVVASIIVGSAMIFVAEVGPALLGYSVIGIVGFVAAGFLGLWLAWAVLRSGRL